MSATNHTPNYSLPQFIGTDVPTWLVDVNGAFSDIDTAIKNAADAAGSSTGEITALDNRVSTVENGLTATNASVGTLRTTVQEQGGSIAANTAKIGTAALQTESQNLSGAINELLNAAPSLPTMEPLPDSIFSLSNGVNLATNLSFRIGNFIFLNAKFTGTNGYQDGTVATIASAYRPSTEAQLCVEADVAVACAGWIATTGNMRCRAATSVGQYRVSGVYYIS